jgi:photosystem II stability/assembly factor-like uncharacterized protein
MKDVQSAVKEREAPTKPKAGLARLTITLKDGRAQAVTARTRLRVRSAGAPNVQLQLESKKGEATRFLIDVPEGRYMAEVDAEGFEPFGDAFTAEEAGETDIEFVLSPKGQDLEGGDAEALKGRFEWFARQRQFPAKDFPEFGRMQAMVQRARMQDPELTNARLALEPIDDPLPLSSFGSIGAFVRVAAKGREEFSRSLLKIPFVPKQVGWVDPASLRVFEVDVTRRTYTLVRESGVDTARGFAYAYIDHPGTYSAIGIPKDPAVLATVRAFAELGRVKANAEELAAMRRRLCEVILCAEPVARESLAVPGGFAGNVCDFCVGFEPPSGDFPEQQLMTDPLPEAPIQLPGCNWVSLGPRNINGRVRVMAIHPADGNTVYAGTANAGVWVTHDGGQSWQALMHDQGALEIGALAVHLTDPANAAGDVTIYAGTGEPTWWPGYRGIGVLKSTDSGATWAATGAMPGAGNTGFSAMVVDPTSITADPTTTVVYAGGMPAGLYQSQDGGATWTLMLAKTISSVAMDPNTTDVLYAGVSFEGIYQYDPNLATWNLFNTGLPGGFPQLIQVAIGQAAPNSLYAKLDQTVYAYDPVGNTWQGKGNHGGTTYGYWNNVLAVSPADSNVVIAGGINIERTADGGTTWAAASGLHSDQHAAVFDPTNPATVYVGDDGGVFRGVYTGPADPGTWTKVSDGLILTQFNELGSSLSGPDVIGGGTQDNGTNRTVGSLTWDNVAGADGGYFVIDPADPHILWAEYQGGYLIKSTDAGATWTRPGNFPGGPWVTPFVLDPTSPLEPNRVLLAGGNSQVYRTIDSGSTWNATSPAMGAGINAIAFAPANTAVVFAVTGNGRVWRSSDNGATAANWSDVTAGTIAGSAALPGRSAVNVAVHPTNPDIVYIVFSGFGSNTPGTPGHVFRGTSTNGWATWKWQDVSANLPDIPVNAIEIDRTSPNTMLYIGTDLGVYMTFDGGLSWFDFGAGLPNVVVSDVALNAAGTKLRAATYGYGAFELELAAVCPAVDIYVRDDKLDTGETTPSPSGVTDPTIVGAQVYWWESPDIKVDAYPYYPTLIDGVEFDMATAEDPIRNDAAHPNPNRLYVQVINRGPLPAHNVKVKVLYANAAAGLPALPADFWTNYPNDWAAASAWSSVDPGVPFQNVPAFLPTTPKILLWDWVVPPTSGDHTCLLAVISSDEDPVQRSDANPNDLLVWIVEPGDKHVALRNLHVVTAAAPPGPPRPVPIPVELHNPFDVATAFDIALDARRLPKSSHLILLLEDVPLLVPPRPLPGHRVQRGSRRDNEEWYREMRELTGRLWSYHLLTNGGIPDSEEARLPELHGVLIEPGETVQAEVVVIPPKDPRPGSAYRFSVVQKMGARLIGGSTFELRIPPARVWAEA